MIAHHLYSHKGVGKNAFELRDGVGNKKLVLLASTALEKQAWVEEINSAIAQLTRQATRHTTTTTTTPLPTV